MALTEDNALVGFQSSLVTQWTGHLEAARKAKETFSTLAKQCFAFYAKDCGFMWKGDFRTKYLGNIEKPMFEVTINKTFEYVGIIGPYLFWDYPHRRCKPYTPMEFNPLVFGDVENDPMAAAVYQMLSQQSAQSQAISELRAQLMERYLNYSQREQREKLATEAMYAVVEALIKGRACLWPETYQFPASQRTLTGLFWDSVDNLLIDPDCKDPALKSATWIARRHVNATWEVERRFNLPAGSLKTYASLESNASQVANVLPEDKVKREAGQTNDLIVWYEIFSKGGVGTRQISERPLNRDVADYFDEVVGDYAYLCVAPNVPWFLNAPPPSIFSEEGIPKEDDDVGEMFMWPFQSYIDNRWPVALLDFNPNPEDCWPIPPLAAALGELIALNILVSAFLENAYENRKQVIAYLKSAAKNVEEALRNGHGTVFVELQDNVHDSINKVIQYLNKPAMNRDILDAIQFVSDMFDKRTGLLPFMYADMSTQSRSARDVAAKEQASTIRPEKMAKDVANWMTEAAELERILATFDVTGQDIAGLLGPMGAWLWDQHITSADPEEVVREMTATVEASDIRKPNKDREAQNLQNVLPVLLPLYQQYAFMRGDEEGVRPLNSLIEAMGDAIEQETHQWRLGPFQPAPDPMQEQLAQMELEKGAAEAESKRADAQKKTAEAMAKVGEGQSEQEQRQMEFAWNEAENMQRLVQEQQQHRQKMLQNAAEFAMKGAQMRQEYELRRRMKETQSA